MRNYKLIIFKLMLTTILSCNKPIKSDLQIAYTANNDGVYIYSLTENSLKQIYKAKKVFINEYFKLLNDSIIQVGHQSKKSSKKKERKVYSKYFYKADGDSTFITNYPPYITIDNYDNVTDSIYNINIKTSKSFLASVKDYEHYEYSTLNIHTRDFNQEGKLISQKDTSYSSRSSSRIRMGNSRRNYGESETVLGKTIITERGNLTIKNGNSNHILLKFKGHFEPKFRNGYSNPTLSSDGKRTAFQYKEFEGLLSNSSCIYEMDINTKSYTKIIEDDYFNPMYSPDNKLLLLYSNNRQSKGNTWINDIYVFEIKTKTKHKIGEGDNYLWIHK